DRGPASAGARIEGAAGWSERWPRWWWRQERRRWPEGSERAPRRYWSAVNPSGLFIRRPIVTSLLMLAIAMFGVLAYRVLAVSDLPQVDFPTLNVSASLPGADPNTMATAVASPLERQFTTIAGLDELISSSS